MRKIEQIEEDIVVLRSDLTLLDATDPAFNDTLMALMGLKAELDSTRGRVEDLNAAKYLLSKHGYAFKIFTPEDVERLLEAVEDHDGAGRDIAKIVEHVVNGDDWQTMSDVNDNDEQNLFALIEGTHGDHPEWFGEVR